MPTEPLQPFAPPSGFPLHLAISTGALVGWILAAVFLFWALYTLVAIYHWIRYSHAARVAYPAIAVHLGVSFGIALYALSGALLP